MIIMLVPLVSLSIAVWLFSESFSDRHRIWEKKYSYQQESPEITSAGYKISEEMEKR